MEEATSNATGLPSSFGIDQQGLRNLAKVHWNLSVPVLYEHAIRRGEGQLGEGGSFVARTGAHTGRSVRDKFIVEEESSKSDIWWGNINRPVSPAVFESMHQRMLAYLQGREVFVQDVHCGADPEFRLPVRLVSESAWHTLFAHNMFIRPSRSELAEFRPGFTILHAPGMHATPERDGLNSTTFILVNFAERIALIGGTSYAGEVKKSVFGLLNFLLPPQGVLPMHCSANIGPRGDCAIFFGLSGTGKTTLSADGSRTLVGDDEHGWSPNGVFNFEGGCYAKVIRLSPTAEPEIYATIRRFGTILENVVLSADERIPDVDDASLTENTRASYPLDFIPNASRSGMAPHPETVIMLTADAFGVLPPISRLTPEQAMYHFLSGYTSRVAGTEKGLGNAPQATFSTCFGAPFMPRHPSVYAKMLGERIARHKSQCWLVNTGWSGGAYGVGRRMEIAHTRALVRAALAGHLGAAPVRREGHFGLYVPESCPEVPPSVLDPRSTWSDKAAYDSTAREVAKRFEGNFKQFESYVGNDVKGAAIRAAA
ncbi:MAG TPA: phosphoenolpyruvate carboxykinase [Stellaceae bacterium]|nr:phosphoenolpyruvate carboxykinase [Stellaceae bacterium]